MGFNRTKLNTVSPDITGNITVDTDDISETVTNEYYTAARINTKVAATAVSAFSDVNTAGAVDGDVLSLSGGVWVPGSASASAEVSMIGNGTSVAYPWTGAIASGNEPYSDGKQIEFYSLNLGVGLSTIKYEVRDAGTSDGTSAWTITDAGSYAVAGWVRSISFFPAGTYLVRGGVGIALPASVSYLDYRIFVDGVAHGSIARVSDDNGYPQITTSIVTFAGAPVAATDNKIDVRVDDSSDDLIGQLNIQAERGFIQILKVV